MKHNETGETSPYFNYFRTAVEVRPPEKIFQPHMTEKANLYAVGNISISCSWVLRLQGEQSVLSFQQGLQNRRILVLACILIKAMHMCHKTNPKEQPSAAGLWDIQLNNQTQFSGRGMVAWNIHSQ